MAAFALTPTERRQLLDLARQAIYAELTGQGFQPAATSAGLEQTAGAFVSLHRDHALRGCIGTFVGEGPLSQTVAEMAAHAATCDPRFDSLRADELAEVDIEISVLSPLQAIRDVNVIEVGRHGIFITRGSRRGVLLPQVATEYGWDCETFLRHTCHKAGLPPEAWKDPQTRIEIFTADVFRESEMPRDEG